MTVTAPATTNLATEQRTTFGYTLLCETHDPRRLLQLATHAEDAGFDFLAVSDHFLPWLESHGHSPFAWSLLGAIAARTERIGMATMVTCPYVRYHPAVIAQAAATIAVMSEGRFTLGLGAGERLNEHVVGAPWPSADVRHEMLGEAIEIIRVLWTGSWVSYRGEHLAVDDACIYDLPDEPPEIYIGVSGPGGVELALEADAGICAIQPMGELVDRYRAGGGATERTWCQVPVAWSADADEAKRAAHEKFRFGTLGWKVLSELPNIPNFEEATRPVTPDQVAENIPCGNDVDRVVEAAGAYFDAGFRHVALLSVGPDDDSFLDAWNAELQDALAERAQQTKSG